MKIVAGDFAHARERGLERGVGMIGRDQGDAATRECRKRIGKIESAASLLRTALSAGDQARQLAIGRTRLRPAQE